MCQEEDYGLLRKTPDRRSEYPKAHPKEREAPFTEAWRLVVKPSPLNSSFEF